MTRPWSIAATWRALFVASSAALLGAGCGTLLDGPPANRCASDADCASGGCDVERSMCVATPVTSLRIGIEVVPASDPFGGTPLPVSFPPFDVGGPTQRDFELPLSIPVRGMLEHLLDPVSASLTFTLPSAIPGGPPTRIETQTFTEPQRDEDGLPFNYALQLLPSRVYDVTIQPSGEWRSHLPPIRTVYAARERGTYEPSPYGGVLETWRGVVVNAAGLEQSGMIVRAVETSTRRVVSSTYTTGSDPELPTGHFEITLSPGVSAGWVFSLNASGARIEAGRPSPTFWVDPGTLHPEAEVVELRLPAVSTQVITYRGFVEVADRPGQGTAAALSFTAHDVLDEATQVIGSFRAMVATSEEPGHEGEFEVQLLPGTYDVVVTPTSAEHAVLRETVMLAESTAGEVSGQVFGVPLRTRYPGTVQTLDAEPMFNAQVRGQARGSTSYAGMALPDAAAYARSSDSVTDAMGLFALPLDIGLYDVTVEPPSGTNWPWEIVRDVPIGTADARLGMNLIELSLPVPLTGRAIFAGGVPVASGEVRAYAIVEDGSSTRAIQVGRAQTDAEGRFTLLLPPSL